jgi:hypothetical protein
MRAIVPSLEHVITLREKLSFIGAGGNNFDACCILVVNETAGQLMGLVLEGKKPVKLRIPMSRLFAVEAVVIISLFQRSSMVR